MYKLVNFISNNDIPLIKLSTHEFDCPFFLSQSMNINQNNQKNSKVYPDFQSEVIPCQYCQLLIPFALYSLHEKEAHNMTQSMYFVDQNSVPINQNQNQNYNGQYINNSANDNPAYHKDHSLNSQGEIGYNIPEDNFPVSNESEFPYIPPEEEEPIQNNPSIENHAVSHPSEFPIIVYTPPENGKKDPEKTR